MSSGTCQSSNRYEVPLADCETAAISLGLRGTSASVNSYTARPPACIYSSAGDDILRFNSLETSVTMCGSGDFSYDCICGALGTGMPLPLSVLLPSLLPCLILTPLHPFFGCVALRLLPTF